MTNYAQLLKIASDMRAMAYAPYSHFTVGAALLTETGKIYTGCNIENAAFSPTVCAERVALFKAVSEGETAFRCIAVVGGGEKSVSAKCPPCGVCRQTLAEFCRPDFEIALGTPEKYEIYTLRDMLPNAFDDTKAKSGNVL